MSSNTKLEIGQIRATQLENYETQKIVSISKKLRMIFISILSMLILTITISFTNLIYLKNSSDELTSVSIPIFDKAEKLERNQKELLVLLQRVHYVQSIEELSSLKANLKTQLITLRKQLDEFSSDGFSAVWKSEMESALIRVESGAAEFLNYRLAFLTHEIALDALIDELRDTREKTRALLEDLTFEVSGPNPSVDSESTSTAAELEESFQMALVKANTITTITLEIDAITERGASLRNIPDLDDLEAAQAVLQFKLRGIAVLLGRLENNETRAKLATEIVDIHEHIFTDAGIVHHGEQILKVRGLLDEQLTKQIDPFQQISALTLQTSANARQQVNEARENLANTTKRMIILLVSAAFFAIVTVGWAIIFVVERQINQRMLKLTDAVLAIADGQTDYVVDVTGADELGKMAKALETFKLNASELHRSNQELEKFAYVAAHDLRSPLRAIQDLTEWTLEDAETVLSEDSQHYMELLQSRIVRLDQLLADLLEYSRVGKEESEVASVSIESIVIETSELLDPEQHFDIRYSGLHQPIVTYVIPLRHIILNLINNAIKHHDRNQGAIEVSATAEPERIVFTVQDDGPGILPDYHQKIFGLFQTLKSRDDVEGSGLGLAIVQKSLNHYGGAIHVASDPSVQRGTCFTFFLPHKTESPSKALRAA